MAASAPSASGFPASGFPASSWRESRSKSPGRPRTPRTPRTPRSGVATVAPRDLGPALAAMQPSLLALALRITRDSEAAADVVQRGFLKVLVNAREFEGRSALRTWVWRIVSNEALQWLRERARDRRQLDALALAVAGGLVGSSTANKSPLDELERRRDTERLARALAGLSERDRSLLEFFASADRGAIDGLGSELDVCTRTIRTRLHRARHRLRRALERQG